MYTEELWKQWSEKEEKNYRVVKDKNGKCHKKYLKKGYTHFDHRFWFPDRKEEIRQILKAGLKVNNKHKKVQEWWSFSPFVKILLKTPRYKFQQQEGRYELETKIRPICFSSHTDSLIYGYYSFVLNLSYQEYIRKAKFDDCVLAYRTDLNSKCNIQFSKEVFDEIKRRKECTAIALDIKGYFDHIDHAELKKKWVEVIGKPMPDDQYKVFKSLTQYSYIGKTNLLTKYDINLKKLPKPPTTLLEVVPGKKDYEKYDQLRIDKLIVTNNKPNLATKRHIGIPQGSGMSALLSNIYLIYFDRDMKEKADKEGFVYRRYCDDILIICDSDKAQILQQFTIDKIHDECFLTIQEKKVEVTEFRKQTNGKIRAFNRKKMNQDGISIPPIGKERKYYKSLQYLGFEFNGQDVFIRASSLSRYFRKMKARIVKTISMAYSDKSTSSRIWREQLLHRYTHLGKRNFLSYAYNAAQKQYKNAQGDVKEGHDSLAIRKQLKRHLDILYKCLEDTNMQRFTWKYSKGKAKFPKVI